jgi:hypothetical protein
MTPHIILQQFVQEQLDSQNLLVVLDDSPPLQRIVAVWPSVEKDFSKLMENRKVPKDEKTHWEWLWTLCEFDPREWGFLASIPDPEYSDRLIKQAIQLRLVFPDGTVSEWAKNYLSARALDSFGGIPSRGGRRKDEYGGGGGRKRGR